MASLNKFHYYSESDCYSSPQKTATNTAMSVSNLSNCRDYSNIDAQTSIKSTDYATRISNDGIRVSGYGSTNDLVFKTDYTSDNNLVWRGQGTSTSLWNAKNFEITYPTSDLKYIHVTDENQIPKNCDIVYFDTCSNDYKIGMDKNSGIMYYIDKPNNTGWIDKPNNTGWISKEHKHYSLKLKWTKWNCIFNRKKTPLIKV